MSIFWTPLEPQQVFQGLEAQVPNTVEIEFQGLMLQVEPLGDGKGKIVRLISSDPGQYLRPELAPGSIVPMN
ncbi:MAG TPA: YlzJ-like family protein [Verrucomicrobiae bacterium]|nr:YlzJ-like family protein [Verrucomicrobiae bacterium]